MFYFRADGNSKIGMGHLMRSMSIASNMMEMTDVCFLCADNQSTEIALRNGFDAITLDEIPFSSEEVQKIIRIIENNSSEPMPDDSTESKTNALLIDSYDVNNEYIFAIKPYAKVMIMDDTADSPFMADAVINYNVYASYEEYEKLYGKCGNTVPQFVLGGKYVPLRKEFSAENIRDYDRAENILISTGGSDSLRLAPQIVKALLNDDELMSRNIHVVCGRFSDSANELNEIAESHPNVIVHRDVKNMSTLIGMCDIGLSAGGSTCYELSVMGLPFVVFSYAENQVRLSKSMSDNKVALYAGNITDEESKNQVIAKISDLLKSLSCNFGLRKELGANGKSLVSPDGAKNLSCRLYELTEENE